MYVVTKIESTSKITSCYKLKQGAKWDLNLHLCGGSLPGYTIIDYEVDPFVD